jgi:predicted metal-dependent HD superfamily phosphohydrolase
VETAHAAHQSPGRHYHGWAHVTRCVDQLGTLPVGAPRAVFLAILFHDAVYTAGASDNERRSAALAMETLAARCTLPLPLSDAELRSIERMILATRDHHGLADTLGADEQTMLDIDLSILGAPWDEYAAYARGVREEYVPEVTTDAGFRIGRSQFLSGMLGRALVFLTPEGRRRWDDRARDNMQRELEELGGQPGFAMRWLLKVRQLFVRSRTTKRDSQSLFSVRCGAGRGARRPAPS